VNYRCGIENIISLKEREGRISLTNLRKDYSRYLIIIIIAVECYFWMEKQLMDFNGYKKNMGIVYSLHMSQL
jgi:hypothetical protein